MLISFVFVCLHSVDQLFSVGSGLRACGFFYTINDVTGHSHISLLCHNDLKGLTFQAFVC